MKPWVYYDSERGEPSGTLNSLISVGIISVCQTSFLSQGGISVGPRLWVFP